jgi:hypothetical protein
MRKEQLFYGIHLVMVFFALSGPFLISWYVMSPIYALVSVQFLIFKGCLFNKTHGLGKPEATFYSDILWRMGVSHDHRSLTLFVRTYLYPLLIVLSLTWQWLLSRQPLWF